jgi:hypothetical protein
MIHAEKGIDRLGRLAAAQRVRAEVAAVVRALQVGDGGHGGMPQALSVALKAG